MLAANQEGHNIALYNNVALNSMDYCIFWKDKNSNYIGGNACFLKLIGLNSLEEVIGRSDHDFPWAKEAKKYREQDLSVLKGNNIVNLRELRWNTEGSAIVSVNKMPLKNEKGEIIGILGLHLERARTAISSDSIQQYNEKDLFSSLRSIVSGSLTHQEMKCLSLWLSGYSIKESSYHLKISHKTIEAYRKNIKDKIGVHHKYQLIDFMYAKNVLYLFLSLTKLILQKK